MARESEELAEVRRALGAQLAVFRTVAGLTQGQVARATFCDRSTVAHIEKGRSRADERFWTTVDEFCGAEGALLTAFRALAAAKQAHEVRIREAQLAESRAQAQELQVVLRREVDRLGTDAVAGTVDGEPRPGTVEDQEMKRREAIALAVKISIGASLTAADRAILDTPITTSPVPARIGVPDVARVAAMTQNLMAQDRALGGGSCRDAVLGYLNWAQQLRAAAASDDVRRALEAALARLENLAGWTSDDLCLRHSAQRYYLRSLESARRAQEPVLAAHALDCLGRLYLWAGHFSEALQLFRLGALTVPDTTASHGILADLARREAQAHAGIGNTDEVQRTLRRADEHYTRAQDAPDEFTGAVILPDHSVLPGGRANAYSRLASHDQNFAETAVAEMTEALTLRDPGRARAVLLGRITLATNQYRCGETGLANTSTEQILATITQVSSRRTARDLITLGTEICQRTTDSTALDLAHRIHTEVAA